MASPRTLAEKVWERHVVHRADGEPDLLYVDLHLVHEVTSAQAFESLRAHLDGDYGLLAQLVTRVDPTLERTVTSARNAALGGAQDIEKRLVAALKRGNETLVSQIARIRAALYPAAQPQERVLTYASFAIRYGPALLDGLAAEVARWADAS